MVMAAIHTVWADADVPDSVCKWPSYTDLVQILWELGTCQAMCNPNTHGPNDECFMVGMSDLVLQHTPPAFFGSLMAMLASYVECHINDVTTMVASLREVETRWQQKGVRMVSQAPSVSQLKSNPVWVTRIQIWSDLLGAGVDQNKISAAPEEGG